MMLGWAFLNPALLWGLALGAIPILLHLLQRRRYRVRRWAAMEFLQASIRRSSRRLRIEQWLLLLVRALILALVALALSRPLWHSPQWGWLGSRAASQVVLVLDDSYSMGLGSDARGTSRFEWARARAIELVRGSLAPGDSLSVVLASEPARALVRRPTFNLKEAAGQVQGLPLSHRRTDLAGAARLCLEILGASRSAVREVYLVTDAQAVAWRRPEVAEAWRRVAAVSRLHLVGPTAAPARNLAVDAVRVGGPVAPGRSTPVLAQLSNWDDRPARGVVVTLHADGRAVTSARADLPALGATEVRFEHAFPTPGPHTVTVSLPTDDLTVDDRGYAGVVARSHVRVLVLNGRPDADPRRDAAFFVAAALAPEGAVMRDASSVTRDGTSAGHASGITGHASPFQVQVVNGSSFRGADLSAWNVVVLADVPRLAPAERRALANFVQDGGGLLVLPGPSAEPSFYNGDLLAREPALLPARLGAMQEAGTSAPALDVSRTNHPVLARFRNAADVDLSTARFERFYQLGALEPATGARVVCRFTAAVEPVTVRSTVFGARFRPSDDRTSKTANRGGGLPALAERPVGLGRSAMLAFPLSPGWSTLPFKPAFLPFLHGLVAYLGQGPGSDRNLSVGEPLVFATPGRGAVPSTSSWELKGPDGERQVLRPVQAGGAASSSQAVRLEDVNRAGLYQLSARGPKQESGPSTDAWFAVNLRTEESDLRVLTRREVERVLRPAAMRWVDAHESLPAVIREGRLGREAWRGLLVAVLVLLLCESGMAQRFGRRRD